MMVMMASIFRNRHMFLSKSARSPSCLRRMIGWDKRCSTSMPLARAQKNYFSINVVIVCYKGKNVCDKVIKLRYKFVKICQKVSLPTHFYFCINLLRHARYAPSFFFYMTRKLVKMRLRSRGRKRKMLEERNTAHANAHPSKWRYLR